MVPLPALSSDIAPIREALDGVSSDGRVNWMRGLGRGQLRALYDLAEGAGTVDFGFLTGAGEEVIIHEGQNSLPMFTRFQKRFCRWDDGVQGYNHNAGVVSWFSGPGHFTCQQDGAEVLIDYTALPATVPEIFPTLIDNDGGTRRLVFGGMVDRLRRVSRHCTIGRAYKQGKAMGAWFMLTRLGDPPAPTS